MFLRRHSLRVNGPSIIMIINYTYIYRDPIKTHAKVTGLPSKRTQAFPPKDPAWALSRGPSPSCIYPPGTLPQHVTHSAFRGYFFTK